MRVYVVTNGIYEDRVTIGVAASREEAAWMILAATQLGGRGEASFEADFDIQECKTGQLYDRLGNKL